MFSSVTLSHKFRSVCLKIMQLKPTISNIKYTYCFKTFRSTSSQETEVKNCFIVSILMRVNPLTELRSKHIELVCVIQLRVMFVVRAISHANIAHEKKFTRA